MFRKILFLSICLWATLATGTAAGISVPRLSPLPVRSDESKLFLNGEWVFTPSWDGTFPENLSAAGWKPIQVPGEWVMQGFEVKPGTPAGYAREFAVPAAWRGRRIKLRCNAVYSECTVYIDGTPVGSHLGGFTPFEIDITDRVRFGEKNRITIAVASESLADSAASGSKYAVHPLGGITRDIYLLALPGINFSRFHVSTTFDSTYTDAVLRAEISVSNESGRNASGLTLAFTLTDAEGKAVALTSPARTPDSIAAGATLHVEVPLEVSRPRKWDPEHPYLYTFVCELRDGDRTVASTSRRVGFRQIEVRGNRLFVNNRPVKLRGVCRHEVMPLRGRSLTGDIWRQDVELFRRGNVNYIRTSHYPPDEALLDACDELGMFVEVEAPFCWAHETNVPADRHEAVLVNQHVEMVNRDRSHPSVLMWSIGNESLKFAEYFKRAAEIVRELDPTRPRNFSQWGPEADEGMLEVTNHHYPGPSGPAQYRDYKRPVVFDEYCHLNAYNRLELAADPGLRNMWGPLLDAMWNDMYRSRGVLGGAIWVGIDDTFFLPPDDRAVGYGTWGVIDGWRREKPEYWGMKKAYSPVRLTLTGNTSPDGTVRLRAENRHLFSDLSECRIKWRAGGGSGTVSAQVEPGGTGNLEIRLPDSLKLCPTLEVSVIGVRGFEIDRYCFRVVPEAKTHPAKTRAARRLRSEETSQTIAIQAGGRRFVVDKRDGLFRVEKEGRTALRLSPSLMLLPLNGEGEGVQMTGRAQTFAPYTPVCADWTAETVEYRPGADRAEVCVRGRYAEADGAMTYRFEADGSVSVDYDFTLLKDVSPRQTGLVFSLPGSFTDLAWEREGYWNAYPDDHIGAPKGHARAFDPAVPVSGLAGPSREPDMAWGFDQTANGSNLFRSTKENIRRATLSEPEGESVSVVSDGSQHFRSWVDGDTVRFLVADYNNAGSERFLVSHAEKGYRPLRQGDRVQGTVRLVF